MLGLALVVTAGVYWTLHEASKQTDHRVNAIVCVTRPYIASQRARNLFTATHDQSATHRATAWQAVFSADTFLSGLLTSPAHFNCAPLLKQLAKEKRQRDSEAPHGP